MILQEQNVIHFCSQIKGLKSVKGSASKNAVQGRQKSHPFSQVLQYPSSPHLLYSHYRSHSNPWDGWANDSYAVSKTLGQLRTKLDEQKCKWVSHRIFQCPSQAPSGCDKMQVQSFLYKGSSWRWGGETPSPKPQNIFTFIIESFGLSFGIAPAVFY